MVQLFDSIFCSEKSIHGTVSRFLTSISFFEYNLLIRGLYTCTVSRKNNIILPTLVCLCWQGIILSDAASEKTLYLRIQQICETGTFLSNLKLNGSKLWSMINYTFIVWNQGRAVFYFFGTGSRGPMNWGKLSTF